MFNHQIQSKLCLVGKSGSLHKGEDLFEVGFVMGGPELFFVRLLGRLRLL